ncbi:transcription factor RF2a-like [Cicer arietinum]|uniref:Probable transcription factor PosF21 n=1 Tax=Cicer arietinum TaxID=3827 RepID=A0A3Q7YGD7_CICAR|nr:probable transcription factor PosF21 [Cicer arietinum]
MDNKKSNDSVPGSASNVKSKPPSSLSLYLATKFGRKQRQSMNGSATKKIDSSVSTDDIISNTDSKKSLSDVKLRKLALIDPKCARRILTKRKFFARLRERKINNYIYKLKKRVQALQTIEAYISAKTSMLQSNVERIAAENNLIKLDVEIRMQYMYSQMAMIAALEEEMQQLIGDILQLDYDNNRVIEEDDDDDDNDDEEEEEKEEKEKEDEDEDEDKEEDDDDDDE